MRLHSKRGGNGYALFLATREGEDLQFAQWLHMGVGKCGPYSAFDLIMGECEILWSKGDLGLNIKMHKLLFGVLENDPDVLSRFMYLHRADWLVSQGNASFERSGNA